jgi:Cu+-exporting ATPase
MMARDPICGMDVDRDQAAARSEHGGRTFYFCSMACKTQFDKNPAQYDRQPVSQ